MAEAVRHTKATLGISTDTGWLVSACGGRLLRRAADASFVARFPHLPQCQAFAMPWPSLSG